MSLIRNKKILITGASGFLGSHVAELVKGMVFCPSHDSYDLTIQRQTSDMMKHYKPDTVYHCAGLVGGIGVNKARPAEFFYHNLMMGTNVLQEAWASGAKKVIAAGAGCGYPLDAPIPIKEESYWQGYPQHESAAYSLAKRMLIVQGEALWRQYQFPVVVCIPGNIYGPRDNFSYQDSHVIPGLVRKFVEAVEHRAPSVRAWGTGKPTRDFVYVEDVARGMVQAASHYDESTLINLSSGVETSIAEVVESLIKITSFAGTVEWNTSKPDGQPRRCFDVSKAKNEFNFKAEVNLFEGLGRTVEWFRRNRSKARL